MIAHTHGLFRNLPPPLAGEGWGGGLHIDGFA